MKKKINNICSIVSALFILIGFIILIKNDTRMDNVAWAVYILGMDIVGIGLISLGSIGLLMRVYFINKQD